MCFKGAGQLSSEQVKKGKTPLEHHKEGKTFRLGSALPDEF